MKGVHTMQTITTPDAKQRLEEIRQSIENENVSYSELAELADLVDYIEYDDVVLLEWAGVDEETYNQGIIDHEKKESRLAELYEKQDNGGLSDNEFVEMQELANA